MSTDQLPKTPEKGLMESIHCISGRRDSYRPNGAIKKTKEKKPPFEELQSIEKERREILQRAELPMCRVLLFWSGTCLKEMTKDSLVWITLTIYVGFRIYANFVDYVPDSVSLLEDSNIDILGGFLSFFLVLFVNQTNGRFLTMYGFSKACSGRIQDLAGLARAQLPSEVGDRLVRHLNAAHIAGYVGLNGIGQGIPYSKTFFFDVYNEKHNLLTPDEMEMVEYHDHDMDHSGQIMKELCTWCQIQVAQARKAGHIDSFQEKSMHDCILAFRAAADGMYDYTDQPPHFFYIHFLDLLSALYLPLFAITTACSAGWGQECYLGLDVVNGLIVLLQCIFVVGLRSLGTKMIDPYGDDHEDLSVILYVEGTLETCDTIMNTEFGLPEMTSHLPPVYKVRHANDSARMANDTTQEPPVYKAPNLSGSTNEANATTTSGGSCDVDTARDEKSDINDRFV